MNPTLVVRPGTVPAFLSELPYLERGQPLFAKCLGVLRPSGLHLEFGVADGNSLRLLREMIPLQTPLYGFDWFRGLPEATPENPVGTFATDKRISLPNTELIEGLFEDTLDGFLADHAGSISFVNIDCDLYSATSFVLHRLMSRTVPGTVIYFDEFFGHLGWEQHEYLAFREFVAVSGCRYRYFARSSMAVAVQIV